LADEIEDRPVFMRLPATAPLGCSLGRAEFFNVGDVDLHVSIRELQWGYYCGNTAVICGKTAVMGIFGEITAVKTGMGTALMEIPW